MNIRVAREIRGCSSDVFKKLFTDYCKSVIIAGPPASGKTTFLRDIIRCLSDSGKKVCAIDERREIANVCCGICNNDVGVNTDIYYGYPKEIAISMAVRTMSPDVIAVDEICRNDEVKAIEEASNCGVSMLVSVHADSITDIISKQQTITLLRTGAFDKVVMLGKNGIEYTKEVFDVEELNDEIYRRRAYLGMLSYDRNECIG